MNRTRARAVALLLLYRQEFVPVSLDEAFAEEDPGDQRDYIVRLFEGVNRRRPELDRRIGERTVGWRFERLALLDRNILRVGAFEILERSDDVPPEVAIDAAVELSKLYGTDPACSYVNGILDRIWKDERGRAEA
ncbi:MAG: transcription antitermination factor NusB [Candidatus Bipolaricaulota bacterium]